MGLCYVKRVGGISSAYRRGFGARARPDDEDKNPTLSDNDILGLLIPDNVTTETDIQGVIAGIGARAVGRGHIDPRGRLAAHGGSRGVVVVVP